MHFILILFVSTIIISCKKPVDYSDIPEIKYMDFIKSSDASGKDTLCILKFSFVDGKGDIGLEQDDTLSPYDKTSIYYNNMYIYYYGKTNGTYTDTMEIPYRIPVLSEDIQEKTIKGEIEVQLSNSNTLLLFLKDTLKFQFFIYDRALNKSNLVESPELFISK